MQCVTTACDYDVLKFDPLSSLEPLEKMYRHGNRTAGYEFHMHPIKHRDNLWHYGTTASSGRARRTACTPENAEDIGITSGYEVLVLKP